MSEWYRYVILVEGMEKASYVRTTGTGRASHVIFALESAIKEIKKAEGEE